MRKAIVLAAVLAHALFGCAARPDPKELSYPLDEHLVNGKLVTVEVIRVNGTQAPGRSLQQAVETFARYIAGEVRCVDGETVTLEADAQGLLTAGQLEPVIARRRYRGPSDIAVLLTPGLSDGPHRGTCTTNEGGGDTVIIQQQHIDESFRSVSRERRHRLVITHELCHALNVPASRSHAWSGRHCTSPTCVLYPRADGRAIGVTLLRLKPPMDLCSDCRREIRQAQQAAGGELVGPDQPFDRTKWVKDLVRLNPQQDDLPSSLYWDHIHHNRYDTAMACCSAALEQADPSDRAGWYWRRACAAKFKGDLAAAAADMECMVRAIPDTPEELNNAAWALSTAQGDEHGRDGACAVRLATRACELTEWKQAQFIDTLAAAYAEAGDFTRAVEAQSRAIKIASPQDKDGMQQRLSLYRQGKPFREDRPFREGKR